MSQIKEGIIRDSWCSLTGTHIVELEYSFSFRKMYQYGIDHNGHILVRRAQSIEF